MLMRFSEQMNIELMYDMQGMNNETKTYQTFTYWQKLSDLLMLLHFVTRFIRTSTVHNTTQSSFTQSLSKGKTKCHRGTTTRYGMRLQAVTHQARKTLIDQRIAARQTCCYTCNCKNVILALQNRDCHKVPSKRFFKTRSINE